MFVLKDKAQSLKNLSNVHFIGKKMYISSSLCILNNCGIIRYNYWLSHNQGSRTINKFVTFNKDFNIINEIFINEIFINGIDNDNIRCGIEDVRLYKFNDHIYYIGSYKYMNDNGVIAGIFNNEKTIWSKKLITKYINYPTDFKIPRWEKNWVYFTYEGELMVIYQWYPIYICRLSVETQHPNIDTITLIEMRDMPELFSEYRGSSCGIQYEKEIWFLVHKSITMSFGDKQYVHRIVVFNEEMLLKRYSDCFIIEKDREFAYGLLIIDDKLIISYSTDNTTSKILTINIKDITHLFSQRS